MYNKIYFILMGFFAVNAYAMNNGQQRASSAAAASSSAASSSAASSSADNNLDARHARADADRVAQGLRVPIDLPLELRQNPQLQLLPDRILEAHSIVYPLSQARIEALNFGENTNITQVPFQEAFDAAVQAHKPFVIARVIAAGRVNYFLPEELHHWVFYSPENIRDLTLPLYDPRGAGAMAEGERRLNGFHIRANLSHSSFSSFYGVSDLTDMINRSVPDPNDPNRNIPVPLDTRSVAYFVFRKTDDNSQAPFFDFIGTLEELLDLQSAFGRELRSVLQWEAADGQAPRIHFVAGRIPTDLRRLIASQPQPQQEQRPLSSSASASSIQNNSVVAPQNAVAGLAEQRIGQLAGAGEVQNARLDLIALQIQMSLYANIRDVRRNIIALQGQIAPLPGDVQGLRTDITVLQGQIAHLGRILDFIQGLQGDVRGLRDDRSGIQDQIVALMGRLNFVEQEFGQLRQPWYQRLIQSRLCRSVGGLVRDIGLYPFMSRVVLTATTAATIGTLLKLKAFNSRAMLAVAGIGAAQLLLSPFGIQPPHNRFVKHGILGAVVLGLIHSPAFFLSSKLGLSGLGRVGAYVLLAGSSLASALG